MEKQKMKKRESSRRKKKMRSKRKKRTGWVSIKYAIMDVIIVFCD